MAKRRTETRKRTPASTRSRKAASARGRGKMSSKTTARTGNNARAGSKRAARSNRKAVAAPRGEKAPSRRAAATRRNRRSGGRRSAETTIPTPPSSLNLNRNASAVRSGRAEILEHLQEHNETSPALTAGDVDADWEKAYDSGDEAPGGDNPTPDQDVVDDIGKALGIQYDDAEELKGADKVARRDVHRWELDPASSEDYPERAKK